MNGIRFCSCSVLLMLLALGQPVAAETVFRGDGNDLLRDCTFARAAQTEPLGTQSDALLAGRCFGMVRGIVSFRELIFPYMEGNGFTKPVCFPEQGIAVEQAVRVVLKYLNDHPEKLHMDDAILVAVALADAFPCRKQ